MNAKKVIIDCDPGIDDSLALMLALASPELEILGITIVSGNVSARLGAQNALKVLEWMKRPDIPVYVGEELPLKREYIDASDTHGADGFGESGYAVPKGYTFSEGAVPFLINTLKTQQNVSVIALGPLTNIARVVLDAPECLSGLDEFVSMGGNYRSNGNCSPVAEYNYWCDPDAAKLVYESFSQLPYLKEKKIHMVGLDVTRKIVLTPNILEYIRQTDPLTGKRIADITRFYFDFHWNQEKVIGCVINDPLAVAYFIDRNLLKGFDAYTTVETDGICIGQSVVDAFGFWQKEANSHVLTEADVAGFMAFFLERIAGAREPELSEVLRQLL